MTSELAAAVLALKEMYERESAELADRNDRPLEGERDLPEQPAASAEAERDPARAWAEEAKARVRIARAMTALAAEHERRLEAEAELDRLRAEIELMREQLREALHQAQSVPERVDQVAACTVQFRRGLSGRWMRLSGVAVAVLLSGWLLHVFAEQALNGSGSVVAAMMSDLEAAEEKFRPLPQSTGEPATELTKAIASPQSLAPNLHTAPPTLVAKPIETQSQQTQIPVRDAANSSALQDDAGLSQSKFEPPEDQQQFAVAAVSQEGLPEGKVTPPTKTSENELPDAGQIQTQARDSLPGGERTDAAQDMAQDKVRPRQPESASTDDTRTPSSRSLGSQSLSASTAPASVGANETMPKGNAVAKTVVSRVSVYYGQSSSSAHADAERIAALLVQAGIGVSQLLRTQHMLREPVVRYFFAEDAEAAVRIVTVLRRRDARWEAEDCTHYMHKPQAGNIQIWPVRIR